MVCTYVYIYIYNVDENEEKKSIQKGREKERERETDREKTQWHFFELKEEWESIIVDVFFYRFDGRNETIIYLKFDKGYQIYFYINV